MKFDLYENTTGTLLRKLKMQGETNIDKIAEAMDDLRNRQLKEGIFSFDSFTETGSDAFTKLSTSLGGEKKACIIWSVNHYLGLNRHPDVIAKSISAIEEFGTGCGTSAISGGMNSIHKKI